MAPRSTPTPAVTARCLGTEHASRIEAQLKAEVTESAEQSGGGRSGQAAVMGTQVPEELARREKRLTEIARAKAMIEFFFFFFF